MTELSEEDKEELLEILDKMERNIRETRPKCTKSWQLELLDKFENKIKDGGRK